MTGKIVTLIAAMGLVSGAAASNIVIDFADLEFPDGNTHDVGESYSAHGFTITKGPGEPWPFAVFGQQHSSYPGQAALFNNTVNGLIRLTQDTGGPFAMVSIDLAPLNSAVAVQVNFTGYLNGNLVAQQSFTHSGSAIVLETFFFSGDFSNIDALEWSQVSPFHQFSNVTMIPAPAALAMFGLAGLVGVRRRRH